MTAFAPFYSLFDTLNSAVSECSSAVCGQACGQRALLAQMRHRLPTSVQKGSFLCSGLEYCTSAGAEKQGVFESGVSVFSRHRQGMWPVERKAYLTCAGANKCLQLCVPQRDCSGYPDLAETPYRSPYFGRKRESPPCSVGHFSEPGFAFCSLCHPGRNICSPAGALARGRRCTPSCRETRESWICCPHGRTNLSGRSHTAQITPPENTRRSRANEGFR